MVSPVGLPGKTSADLQAYLRTAKSNEKNLFSSVIGDTTFLVVIGGVLSIFTVLWVLFYHISEDTLRFSG